ncbi:hypothetical protein L202_03997 [Cryptococcus amylolentus CBS 6039]|uniref:Methionyl-tRNA formyltransferase n=1 Tax=Cryptococcus amylolentus CBS 6039 TaxID=1295533 RepID=A0A1E3HQE6_9TREE|nr:hypothetical protein L202_03997 [Cryptococcus amylolentus CBS 6039]ODN78355.1 hypothetical protein L202_03997 [Cryptococcus amylolentus CBS 6039]
MSISALSPPQEAPLGPLASLPPHAAGLAQQKILLLVTSVNSFTQRVLSYLQFLGFEHVSVQLAISDEAMLEAAESWQPDIVLCPFLTKKLSPSIHNTWITLVVHPGPPGDAGPSSLDWVLLGDTGAVPSSTDLLPVLLSTLPSPVAQRSHWGTICFQATEDLDGGAVWAWEQYPLPPIGSVTKAGVYQNLHSPAAMTAVITALIRVYEKTAGLDKAEWMNVAPEKSWQELSVSLGERFLGGKTHERPLLQSAKRRPDWEKHTAEDVLRILNASDSQPGAMLHPLTSDAKASLFAYGAHLHKSAVTLPSSLFTALGFTSFEQVPAGTPIATRLGAVLFKTAQTPTSSAAIWITHGRVPRGKDKPIDPKIPMAEAIKLAGHGRILENVQEWTQETWEEREGEWQEVFVRSVKQGDGIAQFVYWSFYNGAFTTQNCRTLLSALQWAADPSRGDVKVLALMGSGYFSNGIALNTIEHASSPGQETWDNICAIDDIVSFLCSDISDEQPAFMQGQGKGKALSERGIVTVACVRGNAAAGGVALATACDVVLAGRGVVLNPSYRGMGLHGSELHSFSYLHRCGPIHAAEILREMKPLNTSLARAYGLVDGEIGSGGSSVLSSEDLFISAVRTILSSSSTNAPYSSAPWARPTKPERSTADKPLVAAMAEAKVRYLTTTRTFPPLHHFRQEELSQMLLDSFHPIRSERYHSRRYKFVRKSKAGATPARYAVHEKERRQDEEDKAEFDDAPGWVRGEEWAWAGLEAPKSLKTSEVLRIPLYPSSATFVPVNEHLAKPLHQDDIFRRPSQASASSSSGPDEPLIRTPSPAKLLDAGVFENAPQVAMHESEEGQKERPVLRERKSSGLGAKLRQAFGLKPKASKGSKESLKKDEINEALGRKLGKGEEESEWPCLVTGGEEWQGHAEQGNVRGPKVEEV